MASAALTALTVLRQEAELAIHVRGALRNGLSPEQIAEVFLHAAVYAGMPAVNRAFAVAQQLIADGNQLLHGGHVDAGP